MTMVKNPHRCGTRARGLTPAFSFDFFLNNPYTRTSPRKNHKRGEKMNIKDILVKCTVVLLLPMLLLATPVLPLQALKADVAVLLEQQSAEVWEKVSNNSQDGQENAGSLAQENNIESNSESSVEKVNSINRVSSVSRSETVDRNHLYVLAQVIEGEAAGEPYEGKVAVGAVILNRTESPDFPKTIPGVIYEKDAFESVTNGQYHRPLSDDSMRAAVDALNGNDPTNGALFFWNPSKATSKWIWSRPIVTTIGDHVFAY